MKKISIKSSLSVYGSMEELSPQIRNLCTAAKEAIAHSYAAYSRYKVGAAVLLDDGSVIKGANQENAVYPLGLCAERVAIFSACGQYPEKIIVALAVTTEKMLEGADMPSFPCGSCRQSMIEIETRFGRDIPVYIFGKQGGIYMVDSIKAILPFAFNQTLL